MRCMHRNDTFQSTTRTRYVSHLHESQNISITDAIGIGEPFCRPNEQNTNTTSDGANDETHHEKNHANQIIRNLA